MVAGNSASKSKIRETRDVCRNMRSDDQAWSKQESVGLYVVPLSSDPSLGDDQRLFGVEVRTLIPSYSDTCTRRAVSGVLLSITGHLGDGQRRQGVGGNGLRKLLEGHLAVVHCGGWALGCLMVPDKFAKPRLEPFYMSKPQEKRSRNAFVIPVLNLNRAVRFRRSFCLW